MVVVFLADGFEEIEALTAVDVLRRADINVVTVGIGGKNIRGAHGIMVAADVEDSNVKPDKLEAVVLPGGMPGTVNLEKSAVVQHFIDVAVERNLPVCAICAAPSILGHRGLLNGKKAVCYPGFEKDLTGAVISSEYVVHEGQFITAKGAGAALDFSLKIVSVLLSPERADEIAKSMQCRQQI
ncbi:MAG: DJ-1/PfpI family protein [Oscillospiraceae bacterium]|jgi:4-methyl-5(b-hydroxyethyl)-thiazole monophosphate biosynthesis|nr:DJ-1/PfpI family protein [Oscillospiraceae bacterium]